MRARVALYVALLIAGLVTGMTIRNASFTPWGTDPASYVNAARRWAERDLFAPEPFQLWPRWNQLGVPVGNTRGAVSGTYVSIYPLGFPVLLAAGDLLTREFGVYVIGPLFAGLLVLVTFFTGRQVTRPSGALLAAVLVALSPVVLIHAITTMSDVPATALVLLAFLMSLRSSLTAAIAGGLALALAVMTRPVLAPLGIVPFVLILMRSWRHAAVFTLAAAIGPAMLLWSQSVLYGGPLKTGYPGFESYFSRERIALNAEVYVRNLSTLHSPFLFLGFAAALPLYFTRDERSREALKVIVGLMVLVVLNYASYLPYMTYDDIWSTRFFLPAQVALFLLLAAAATDAIVAVSRLTKVLAVVCIVPVLIVVNEGRKVFPGVFEAWRGQSHARLIGYYLRDALPPNAAVISYLHSGAIAYYTAAQIVRFDLMSKADTDLFIDALVRRRYQPVFVIDVENEWGTYVTIMTGTKYERLEWPERARATGIASMSYQALSDRDRPRERVQPIDVLIDR